MMPQTQYNVILKANTSLEFNVVVSVQAVNHFYRHSYPSSADQLEFPPHADFDESMFRGVDPRNIEAGELDDGNGTESGPAEANIPDEQSDYSQSSGGFIAGLVVLGILSAILFAVIVVIYRKKTRSYKPPPCCQYPRAVPECVVIATPKDSPPSPPQKKSKCSQTFDHSFYVVKHRRRTPISCLRRDYVDRLRPNCHYAMKAEFERVPSGPTDMADDARSPHNAALNRSQNVLPYDKNRVR